MTFSLDIRSHSETGPLRKNNQDSGFASPRLLVVADGMGGAAAGDLASTVAIREVEHVDRHLEGEAMLEVLGGAVSRANDHLADLVQADPALDGMGTTFTGALFSGTQLGVVHIGDSRAYLLRAGELERVTTDHSWVMSLVREGKISEEEAETHPHRNLLLKVLNGQPVHTPDSFLVDVQEGDRLLLCSDGLCGFANDRTLHDILLGGDLDDVMQQLVDAAYEGGGADNITIVLADVIPHDETVDAAPGAVIGAAVDTEIPDLATLAATAPEMEAIDVDDDDEEDEVDPDTPVVIDPERIESVRYAPTLPKHHRWRGPLLGLVLALVALGGLGWGGVAYAQSQYYVGAEGSTVTVYNGVPGQLLGLRFQRVHETTDVTTADLPPYYRTKVQATIQSGNLDSARATVSELRTIAEACRAKRASRGAGSSAPTAASPSQSTPSAAPSTPAGPGAPLTSRGTTGLSAGPSGSPLASPSAGQQQPTSLLSAPETPGASPSVNAQEDC